MTPERPRLGRGIGEPSPEPDDDRRDEKNEDHNPDDPRRAVSLYEQEHIDHADDDDDFEPVEPIEPAEHHLSLGRSTAGIRDSRLGECSECHPMRRRR